MIDDRSIAVQIRTTSPTLRGELAEIVTDAGGSHVLKPEYTGYCDLLIMDIGRDIEQDFQFLSSWQAAGLAGEVFLTSAQKDSESEILLRALQTGAREFFRQPIPKEEVRDAYLRFVERYRAANRKHAPAGKKGKIINVVGSKGGVGTTTVAVNLAASLIKLKDVPSVVLVDMNPLLGDVPIFLNMRTEGFDWLDVSHNISRIDETYLDSILARHPLGITVIPPPLKLIDENKQPIVDTVETLLSKMQKIFDFIVVDSGQHLGEVAKTIMKIADRVLVVTVLNLPYVINVNRLMNIFRDLGYPPEDAVDIIVNRFEKRSPVSLQEAEETIKKKIRVTIPNDYKLVSTAINQGQALVSLAEDSHIARSFRNLAADISGKGEIVRKKTGFLGLGKWL